MIHSASGAVVMLTSQQSFAPRSGMIVREASPAVASETHWWTGESYALREDAVVAFPLTVAEPGDELAVTKPADAWYVRTDGTIGNGATVAIEPGYKDNRITLIGRYRGEAVIGVVPLAADEAMAAVRDERDRRLVASDKYVLPDFPIDGAMRGYWLDYRSALRELPEAQPVASLATVVWPSLPIGGDA